MHLTFEQMGEGRITPCLLWFFALYLKNLWATHTLLDLSEKTLNFDLKRGALIMSQSKRRKYIDLVVQCRYENLQIL